MGDAQTERLIKTMRGIDDVEDVRSLRPQLMVDTAV